MLFKYFLPLKLEGIKSILIFGKECGNFCHKSVVIWCFRFCVIKHHTYSHESYMTYIHLTILLWCYDLTLFSLFIQTATKRSFIIIHFFWRFFCGFTRAWKDLSVKSISYMHPQTHHVDASSTLLCLLPSRCCWFLPQHCLCCSIHFMHPT